MLICICVLLWSHRHFQTVNCRLFLVDHYCRNPRIDAHVERSSEEIVVKVVDLRLDKSDNNHT
jgi:hypothetical protein